MSLIQLWINQNPSFSFLSFILKEQLASFLKLFLFQFVRIYYTTLWEEVVSEWYYKQAGFSKLQIAIYCGQHFCHGVSPICSYWVYQGALKHAHVLKPCQFHKLWTQFKIKFNFNSISPIFKLYICAYI